MKIATRQLGELEVHNDGIIEFENGLPGFLKLRRWAVIKPNGQNQVFSYLQSIDDTDISFVLMDAAEVIPDYNPLVDSEFLNDLGNFKDDGLLVYNIANIPENIKEMTVNLKAPVVINMNTQKGKQVIANNEDYSIRHKVFGDNSSEAGEA